MIHLKLKGIVGIAHKSNYPDPISFVTGDELVLGDADDEYIGWIKVTTHEKNVGWAPIEYIELHTDNRLGTAICDYSAVELNTIEEEGLLVGGSSGANVWAALKLAAELTQPATIVTILPDSGIKYLSKIYNDAWMQEQYLL